MAAPGRSVSTRGGPTEFGLPITHPRAGSPECQGSASGKRYAQLRASTNFVQFGWGASRRSDARAGRETMEAVVMTRLISVGSAALLLALVGSAADAAGCAAGSRRAGCVGPNGAVVAGPGGVHAAAPARPATVNCAAGVVRAGCAGPNGAVVAGPGGVHAAAPARPPTVKCAAGVVRAGCVGPNGAVVTGPR